MRGILRTAQVVLVLTMAAIVLSGLALAVIARTGVLRVRNEITGSMAPALQVDDLVVYRPTTGAGLRPGDVIGVRRPEEAIEVTHRVVSVQSTGELVTAVTKGDANSAADTQPVVLAAGGVVWRVWFAVPELGRVESRLSGGNGLPFVLGLLPLMFALSWILRQERDAPPAPAARAVKGRGRAGRHRLAGAGRHRDAARAAFRPGPLGLAVVLAVVFTAAATVSLVHILGTRSTLVSSRPAASTAITPALVAVGLLTPKTTAPQTYALTGLTPGTSTDHLVNIRNDGTATVPAIDLGVTTTTNTALDTDPVNGLVIQVQRCSLPWEQQAPGQLATCAGTTATLLGSAALSTLNAAAPARKTSGLAALSTGGVDHLRVRFGVPSGAPAGYGSLLSMPTFSIWGVTVPGAPTGFTLTPGDGLLTATWTAPADNGGATVTGYTVTLSPGGLTCVAATSAGCAITGLTNGVTYTGTVTATNSLGTSQASTSATEIPYPSLLSSSAGRVEAWFDASATATVLTAAGTPATAGQSVQTVNDRSGNNRNVTQGTAANQMTVGTLNGRQALQSADTNFYSSSATATMRTVVAIASPSSTANKLQLLLATPANTNGVTARVYNGRLGSSSGTLNGNDWAFGGTSWTNSIAPAVPGPFPNGAGIYVAEAASAIVNTFSISGSFSNRGLIGPVGEEIILNTTLTAAERRKVEEYLARKWSVNLAPDSPTGATATAGLSQAGVSWSAPAGWNGGAAISGYTVTAGPGGASCTTTGTSCTVTGLTPGTSYTFTVKATNSVGDSVPSVVSNAVTPTSAPSAPTGLSATHGNAQATAGWTASPPTGLTVTYTVTAAPGGATCSTTTTSCVLTGLTNGTTYTLSVTAANTAGTSGASATTTVTPSTLPGAPTGLTVTPGSATAAVSWTAPAGNGGAAITGYTVTATPTDGSLATATCTTGGATTCNLSGLTDGAPYTVTVTATNIDGTGSSPTGVELITQPSFLTSGNLSAWFDASAKSTLLTPGSAVATSGQKVQTWNDRSGNNRNATQGTAANQMTVSTLGSRQAVLSGPQTAYTGVNSTGVFRTIVTAAAPDTSVTWNTFFAAPANTDFSQRLAAGYLPSTGAYVANANDWAYNTGTPIRTWINSVQASTAVVSPAVYISESAANVTNSFSLSSTFSSGGTSRGITGKLGEILPFNRVLTSTERRQIEEYLARKWAITVTPQAPTITFVTKSAGGSLPVTWTAPPWNGGSADTGSTVTATSGKTCTAAAGATTCTVTGLTAGVTYPVTMTATNAVGVGVTSTSVNGTA